MIEAEVHSSLRAFLRAKGGFDWPHNLTMARLVARAMRVGRSALIQTGTRLERYCLSYLAPAAIGRQPVIIVVPSQKKEFVRDKIEDFQKWLEIDKEIRIADSVEQNFRGIILTSPSAWLRDRLKNLGKFPQHITTIIDHAEDLEERARIVLTNTIQPQDWSGLSQKYPSFGESIRQVRIKLAQTIFAPPRNLYQSRLIEAAERESLANLLKILTAVGSLTPIFADFWQKWQTTPDIILWASIISSETREFSLNIAPATVTNLVSQIWPQQPVVLIGSFLDWEDNAPIYRQELGIDPDILCLKFSPNRQNEHLQLYLPDRLPLPNTPEFKAALIQQMRSLIILATIAEKSIVLLVEDVPLQSQLGATLAAEFGSIVQVEKTNLSQKSILLSGWKFWRDHQEKLPTPDLLAIATLPIPSLENPLVAARVAFYKSKRQDWFRFYLLPTALREIQTAILPLRESQGILALLDNRVDRRSYGKIILNALEPCARINYLDPNWFDT